MPDPSDLLKAIEGAIQDATLALRSPSQPLLQPALGVNALVAHTQPLADLCNVLRGQPLGVDEQARLEQLMVTSAQTEPVWSLLCAMALWDSGRRLPHDFANLWSAARYAGIASRFSVFTPEQHLQMLDAVTWPLGHPARFLIQGNALRSLHRYSQAEDAYLAGLHHQPDHPFLKFRLVDLWLMTHQHQRAKDLLVSLRSRYLQALEHLFALPVPPDAPAPSPVFGELQTQGANMVWLVAADAVYIQRYGLRLAQGLHKLLSNPNPSAGPNPPRITLHVHTVLDGTTPLPLEVLQAMAALVPMNATQRTIQLQGANANQRKAFFASERFLFLHELLHKYNRPLLVTDIDVDPLKHPAGLFARMGDGDVGHTRFGAIRDAWDRYPATALWFQPTPAAIQFGQSLSATILSLLAQHPEPWFVDQVALFRLIEEGQTPAKLTEQPWVLTDTESPEAFFRILHGSWA